MQSAGEAYPSIENLIPHRSRMKLLDRIVKLEADRSVAAAVVSKEWPLYLNGRVNSLIALELAAQTAGTMNVWRVGQKSLEGRLGYLAGVKSAAFYQADIPVGLELLIETFCSKVLEHPDGQYGVIAAKVWLKDKLTAELTMQVISLKPGEQ